MTQYRIYINSPRVYTREELDQIAFEIGRAAQRDADHLDGDVTVTAEFD